MSCWSSKITISENTFKASKSSPFSERPAARFWLLLVLSAVASFVGCGERHVKSLHDHIVLHGTTMGTTYCIRYRPRDHFADQNAIHQVIEEELEQINIQMSNYREDSEVSRFNRSESSEWFAVSSETAFVVNLAQEIAKISDGAFDVTVGPVVDLWGFGPSGRHETIPSDDDIKTAMKYVGYENLLVRLSPPALRKLIPTLQIDLSAIAKGHGADRVSDLLKRHGIENSFVEIGGEIVVSGYRSGSEPWQIGIESPEDFKRSIAIVVGLSDAALATSGDYRNFFIDSDSRFSHTIDPKTGRPVTHSLASNSVVASTAASADAIATCMMVLGKSDGLRLAEENNWAVLFISRSNKGFNSTYSKRLEKILPDVCKKIKRED